MKHQKNTTRNWVAKYAGRLNKNKVFKSKKLYSRDREKRKWIREV